MQWVIGDILSPATGQTCWSWVRAIDLEALISTTVAAKEATPDDNDNVLERPPTEQRVSSPETVTRTYSAFVLLCAAVPTSGVDIIQPVVAHYYGQRDPNVLRDTMCVHLGLSGGEFHTVFQRYVYYDVELFANEYGFTKLWCRIKEDDPFPFGLLTLYDMPNALPDDDYDTELLTGAFDNDEVDTQGSSTTEGTATPSPQHPFAKQDDTRHITPETDDDRLVEECCNTDINDDVRA